MSVGLFIAVGVSTARKQLSLFDALELDYLLWQVFFLYPNMFSRLTGYQAFQSSHDDVRSVQAALLSVPSGLGDATLYARDPYDCDQWCFASR